MTNVIFEAEVGLIGYMIEHPESISEILERVPPGEWGQFTLIIEALQGMVDLGEEVTPFSLMARLQNAGLLARTGGGAFIHTAVAKAYSFGQGDAMVDVLEAEMLRRRARQVGVRLVQMADNPTVEPEEMVEYAHGGLNQVGVTRGRVETIGWPSEEEETPPIPVIPHLMYEDERAMITGGEGLGKSYLIRQLVASVVIGVHPFLHATFDPAPALHIDLENPRHVSDRAYRLIRNRLRANGYDIPEHLHRLEPRQFDISEPRDVAWLMRQVRAVQPKLIAIGPLKNMTSGNLNEEETAVRVCNVLNRIRAETKSALVVEAHAGHLSRGDDGDWRPRGSSSLLGWPEIGLGMKPISKKSPRAARLVPWRGMRTDDSYWPEVIVESTVWPWTEAPPDYEERYGR